MPLSAEPVTDARDLELMPMIVRRLDQASAVRARFDEVNDLEVAPGSELWLDDEATKWLQLSHVVMMALGMATDNMRALESMLRDPDGGISFPMYAHYPLLRSILEAGAEAKWILLPDERKERVRRALRARISDLRYDAELAREQVAAVMAMDDPPALELLDEQKRSDAARHAKHQAKVKEIAKNHGIEWSSIKGGLPPWVHLVRAVCTIPRDVDTTRVPGEYAAGLWRVMSGLSHPSPSRSAQHSDLDELSETRDGVLHVRVTTSLRWTSEAMTVALNTVNEAIQLLEKRRGIRRL